MMLDLPSTRELVEQYGLLAKKSLGQNFLFNPSIVRKIAQTAGNLTDITVFEVGPGPGGLTRALLEADAKHVVAVEKDQRCLSLLSEIVQASQGRLSLIEEDALILTPQEVIGEDFKIVANLPYNIGTLLLIRWLKNLDRIVSLTLMFQKEVALRIVAKPNTKDYGRLSILSQWLCEAKKIFDLPPSAFMPSPKVVSSVVHLMPRSLSKEEKDLIPFVETITQNAFGQRRKMLRSSLRSLLSEKDLELLDINPQARAEDLPVADFIKLAMFIKKRDLLK